MKKIVLLIVLVIPWLGEIHAAPDRGGEGNGAAKHDACCAALESGAMSKNSLYQGEFNFMSDSGKKFELASLRGHPVVIAMFFARCGYACPLIVTDIQAIRGRLPTGVREQARFVLVSFDTVRDQPTALSEYRNQRGLDAQWILLHGDKDSVREIAALLGVKYAQDADGSFSHSNLITILNAEGEIVHQRIGLQGGLDAAATAVSNGNDRQTGSAPR